ncbi:unnamed protein product [Sympodiomycopsis kandeliae]
MSFPRRDNQRHTPDNTPQTISGHDNSTSGDLSLSALHLTSSASSDDANRFRRPQQPPPLPGGHFHQPSSDSQSCQNEHSIPSPYSRKHASSRDSVISAASGAYYSAEEDEQTEMDQQQQQQQQKPHTESPLQTRHETQQEPQTPRAAQRPRNDPKRSFLSGLLSHKSSPPSSSSSSSFSPDPRSQATLESRLASPVSILPAAAGADAAAAPAGLKNPQNTTTTTNNSNQDSAALSDAALTSSAPSRQRTQYSDQHNTHTTSTSSQANASQSPVTESSAAPSSYTYRHHQHTSSSSSSSSSAGLIPPSPVVSSSGASRRSAKSGKSRRKQKEAPPSPIITPRRGSLIKSSNAAAAASSSSSSSQPSSGSLATTPGPSKQRIQHQQQTFPLAGSASSHPYSFSASGSSELASLQNTQMPSGDLSIASPSLSDVGLALGSPISPTSPTSDRSSLRQQQLQRAPSNKNRFHSPSNSTSSASNANWHTPQNSLDANQHNRNGLEPRTTISTTQAVQQPSASSSLQAATSLGPSTASQTYSSSSSTSAAVPGGGLGVRMGTGSQDIALANAAHAIAEEDSKSSSLAKTTTGLVEKALLQRWILSIGIVNFDLEKGPDLESLWPPLSISKEEKDNIAFSSFPDTSIFDEGDTHFSFRIREVPLDASVSSPPSFGPTSPTTTGPPAATGVSSSGLASPSRLTHSVPSRRGRDASAASSSSSVRSLFHRAAGSSASDRDRNSQLDAVATAELQRAVAESTEKGAGQEDELQEIVDSDGSSRSSVDVTSHQQHGSSSSTATHGSSAAASNGLPRSASFNTIAAGRGMMGPSSTTGAPASGGGKVASSSSSSYLYGYTYFRQRRDSQIRRGYFQKSVVILTHLPYVSLFDEIISKLAPLYFEHGQPILEAFANAVSKWPNPSPGATLPLPLFGQVLWAALPLGRQGQSSVGGHPDMLSGKLPSTLAKKGSSYQMQQQMVKEVVPGSSEEEPVLASIPSTPLVQVLKEALADVWLLWECVLLAEPILVVGPDPKIASEAVWHLMDICRPIPHAGDYRPFFTIHDYDFGQLAGRNIPPAGTIIGCTNPFMSQACSGFQNVLRVGKAAVKTGTAGKYGSKGGGGGAIGGGNPIGGGGTPGGRVGGGQGAGGGGPEHLPGFTTKRKRRISKDRVLLKKLQELLDEPGCIPLANTLLRRHLVDMTERFLSPLNRYVSSLIPSDGTISDPSKIKPFNTDNFLLSLKAHGTPLNIRSRSLPTASTVRQGLYLDFLKSPNFSFYLTERIAYYKTRDPVPSMQKTRFEQQSN